MFIKPDDYIIIMEDNICNPLSSTDVTMLVDSGIEIVYVLRTISWENAIRNNWSNFDNAISKYLNTDLRLLLPLDMPMPKDFPDDWYLENRTVSNYSNQDFMSALDDLIYKLIEHISDIKDRVQFTYAFPGGGEFLWDGVRPDPFPVSDEVIHKFVIDRQKILVNQHGEIWTHFHNFMGGPRNWNNTKLTFLYQALRDEFIDIPFYSIQFAHFSIGGNSPTNWECQSMITSYGEKYKIQFFVGSEYCEGMRINFDAAVKQKARGFFTCSRHFENPVKHNSIEPWMVETIKETNRKFREAYGSKD